ncbi:S-layer homology domain-containing protein [Paenibacillus doosanensis]|uniref:Endo-1,4-beta-xylanase A n=1 Tax=Paenibacillus konkukensis TaxID=2020716 RepID=A0ABY4RWE7_9BACL|nr:MULTISPECIES: S-layer homology domain-containing protein [Paenibacillus]MCS7464358.1 S-layer homology domain-containing protein [Paenibacillus doosanensis]UQZ85873.1 Endo-1,4-beta-xylanase A precursor [Paenibacillus konkukensis]
MKNKKWITLMSTAALLCSVSAGSAYAFSDVDAAEKEPISALQNRGIVSGVDSQHFVPRGQISYAQTVSMIVKGMKLNLNTVKFVKKPVASDYFTNVPNDAWYAESFVIAKVNGLDLPQDIDPNAAVTKEKYADLLIHALDTKGVFPTVKMLILFADEDQIDSEYKDEMQRIYLHKIANLGEDRMAHPKQQMTRGEAAVWLYNTIKFAEAHAEAPETPQQGDVEVSVEKVSDEVNKVILSRQMPHPGYGLQITGIRFQEDGTAVVQYQVTAPDPDKMYPQVVTEVKAATYVASKYKPVAEPAVVTLPGVLGGSSSSEPAASTVSDIVQPQ